MAGSPDSPPSCVTLPASFGDIRAVLLSCGAGSSGNLKGSISYWLEESNRRLVNELKTVRELAVLLGTGVSDGIAE